VEIKYVSCNNILLNVLNFVVAVYVRANYNKFLLILKIINVHIFMKELWIAFHFKFMDVAALRAKFSTLSLTDIYQLIILPLR
jgi:hypothetical protein